MIAIGLLIFLKPEVGKGQCLGNTNYIYTINTEQELRDILDSALKVPNFKINYNIVFNSNSNTIIDALTDFGSTIITNEVKFSPFKWFIIENGSQITFKNFKFTNACPNEMWNGFIVHGNYFDIQRISGTNKTGMLTLENCEVDFAFVGVQVGNFSSYTDNGGILRATNTTFKNCWRGVSILKYPTADNKSLFTDCDFIIDRTFPFFNAAAQGCAVSNQIAKNYAVSMSLELQSVKNVKIIGCIFNHFNNGTTDPNTKLPDGDINYNSNPMPTSCKTDDSRRGYGIYSKNSSFYVSQSCSTVINSPTDCNETCYGRQPEFFGFRYGIWIDNDSNDYEITDRKRIVIRNSIFRDNLNQIRAYKANGLDIYNNIFRITGHLYQIKTPGGPSGWQGGEGVLVFEKNDITQLHIENCDNFFVFDNIINNEVSAEFQHRTFDDHTIWVMGGVRYSGLKLKNNNNSEFNKVFRNTFNSNPHFAAECRAGKSIINSVFIEDSNKIDFTCNELLTQNRNPVFGTCGNVTFIDLYIEGNIESSIINKSWQNKFTQYDDSNFMSFGLIVNANIVFPGYSTGITDFYLNTNFGFNPIVNVFIEPDMWNPLGIWPETNGPIFAPLNEPNGYLNFINVIDSVDCEENINICPDVISDPPVLISLEENLESQPYPNPAEDYINIPLTNCKNGIILISNTKGNIIYTDAIINHDSKLLSIPTSNIGKGIFIFSVFDNGELIKEGKFIVK